MSELPVIWSSSEEIVIPSKASKIQDLIPFADALSVKQKAQIISAFNDLQAYDMAVEFAWRKTVSRLKESLASLGMQFIGEMLGREDITDSTPYETVLTDFQAIQLSEQLGLVSSTAGLHLRQSHELVTHYLSSKSSEDLDALSALNIIKNSVKYVLGYQDMTIAIEFNQFRDKLLRENLKPNDNQIEMLINSPLFYARTVSFILLNSIRRDHGAKIEHALANFNLLLPLLWKRFTETDKWNVGFAYRDVVSENNSTAASGLKFALMKVGGFDFVPESLRSNTFIKAAKNIVDVHYAYDNFYNEPSAVRALASLGTTIPKPAFLPSIQAYLVVCIGNIYGTSVAAANIAEEKLSEIPIERWEYYFSKGIQDDEEVLYNLRTQSQVNNFSNLINRLGLTSLVDPAGENRRLYDALVSRKQSIVIRVAEGMYKKIST